MELRQTRSLVVLELHSLTLTAASLHLTRAAVYKQLHRLGQELNVTVYQKLRTGIRLTDNGTFWRSYFGRVLAQQNQAASAVRFRNSNCETPLTCGGKIGYLRSAARPGSACFSEARTLGGYTDRNGKQSTTQAASLGAVPRFSRQYLHGYGIAPPVSCGLLTP